MAPASDYPIVLFAGGTAFRAWLSAHHASRAGLWLQIAKAGSPLQSVTCAEALDLALCFDWIDGQKRSPWSKRNREHLERLIAAGETVAATELTLRLGRREPRRGCCGRLSSPIRRFVLAFSARRRASWFQLRTDTDAAARFYECLGYLPIRSQAATHRRRLTGRLRAPAD